MRSRVPVRAICVLPLFVLLCVIGCGRDPVTVDDSQMDTSWSYGESLAFEIPAASSVTVIDSAIDSASASILRPPTGGGCLTVRDAVAGPSTLADESAAVQAQVAGPLEGSLDGYYGGVYAEMRGAAPGPDLEIFE